MANVTEDYTAAPADGGRRQCHKKSTPIQRLAVSGPLWPLTAAKMPTDILPAVQHAHDQYTVRLRLIKHDVAGMDDAAEVFGLQILTGDACERILG
jgi:hypothetical protein